MVDSMVMSVMDDARGKQDSSHLAWMDMDILFFERTVASSMVVAVETAGVVVAGIAGVGVSDDSPVLQAVHLH